MKASRTFCCANPTNTPITLIFQLWTVNYPTRTSLNVQLRLPVVRIIYAVDKKLESAVEPLLNFWSNTSKKRLTVANWPTFNASLLHFWWVAQAKHHYCVWFRPDNGCWTLICLSRLLKSCPVWTLLWMGPTRLTLILHASKAVEGV